MTSHQCEPGRDGVPPDNTLWVCPCGKEWVFARNQADVKSSVWFEAVFVGGA